MIQRRAPDRDVLVFVGAAVGAAQRARAPDDRAVRPGRLRRQLTPSGLSAPFSASVSGTLSAEHADKVASSPAGAFHTPRLASVRAMTPATAPHGRERLDLAVAQRVGCSEPREEQRRVLVAARDAGVAPDAVACRCVHPGPRASPTSRSAAIVRIGDDRAATACVRSPWPACTAE